MAELARQIEQARAQIEARGGPRPRVGLILGSGLSALADEIGDARIVAAQHAVLAADSPDDLAAVASRGAPADAVGFDDRDAVAALGQRQRRRNSGEAPADHRDVDRKRTAQSRVSGPVRRGRGIVGGDMLLVLMFWVHAASVPPPPRTTQRGSGRTESSAGRSAFKKMAGA